MRKSTVTFSDFIPYIVCMYDNSLKIHTAVVQVGKQMCFNFLVQRGKRLRLVQSHPA